MIILFILLLLFILIILFIIKLKNNNIESFCASLNDTCMVNQNGKSNCCNNNFCVRKPGNFEYKVCSDKPEKSTETDTGFQKSITNFVGNFVKFEKDIENKFEDITEEEQFVLELKDFCSSSKIVIPNLFYKGKNEKCDCSKFNNDDNTDDDNTDDELNLFSDINLDNCNFFPV
jgi:hypothetical protein